MHRRYDGGVKRPKRSFRPIIMRASIFLLLGAIVNIAVAWGCSWIAGRGAFEPYPYSHDYTADWADRPPGFWKFTPTEFFGGESKTLAETVYSADAAAYVRYDTLRLPPGVALRPPPDVDEVAVGFLKTTVEVGLPCRSLTHVRWSSDWHESCEGGLRVAERYVPFRPVWPGFAINTIFYALILWPLLAAPGFVRRRRRLKRGLCPACAYPIGSSPVCTECGKELPERRGA